MLIYIMSVNLLLSPNEKQLYMSKLTTDSLIYDAGASFNFESESFTNNTIKFDADITSVTGTVYTLQQVNWCKYNLMVFFNIVLEFSVKGTAGDGDLFIDLPTAMPNSEVGYFVMASARFGFISADNSNGYAQFDEGTKRLRIYNNANDAVNYSALQAPGYIYITGSYVAQV